MTLRKGTGRAPTVFENLPALGLVLPGLAQLRFCLARRLFGFGNDEAQVDALLAKQHLATHVVTQMCFSAPKILDYTALLRREGVHLPLWAGVAGSVPRTKLVALATQIGVGSSLKFLSRKGPLARKLLSGDRYSPDSLITGLESQPGTIAGIHLYSFNSLDPLAAGPDQAATSALQTALIRGAARDN